VFICGAYSSLLAAVVGDTCKGIKYQTVLHSKMPLICRLSLELYLL
jgi:hypothetical protein